MQAGTQEEIAASYCVPALWGKCAKSRQRAQKKGDKGVCRPGWGSGEIFSGVKGGGSCIRRFRLGNQAVRACVNTPLTAKPVGDTDLRGSDIDSEYWLLQTTRRRFLCAPSSFDFAMASGPV